MAAWGNAEKNEIFLRLYPKGVSNANHSGVSTEAP